MLHAKGKKPVKPSLNHGDLRLKNVLVSREGGSNQGDHRLGRLHILAALLGAIGGIA